VCSSDLYALFLLQVCANSSVPANFDNIDSDDDLCALQEQQFKDGLVSLIHKHNVSHNCVDDLLKLLVDNGHPHLPRTARTLVGTVRNIRTVKKSGMDYIYFGFNSLTKHKLDNHLEHVEIALNIDGLPLYKSSKVSAWPILCETLNTKLRRVFVVAFAVGESKPTDLDFLMETIIDLQSMLTHGLKMADGSTMKIVLKAIVCDAPAKAMVKATKQYSGFYGCDKCEIIGDYYMHRMTYPDHSNLTLRSDESFRRQTNKRHHTGITPFTNIITLNMVTNFPIDYMHAVCLGAMRKLITSWVKGVPSRIAKLSTTNRAVIQSRARDIRKHVPSEFARKPRSINDIDRWKATELRLFLLYTGRVLLKGVLDTPRYKHYMKLSVSIRILTSTELTETQSELAHQLLTEFVKETKRLYGQEFMTYNIHSLLHLASDAREHGNLDNCSSFPFENHLQIVKRTVRSGKSPIIQMTKRMLEKESYDNEMVKPTVTTKIAIREPNNIYLSKDQTKCYLILEALTLPNNYLVREYSTLNSAFQRPCDSVLIHLYKVKALPCRMRTIHIGEIGYKCVRLTANVTSPFTIQAMLGNA
jgi:hypothetical protein